MLLHIAHDLLAPSNAATHDQGLMKLLVHSPRAHVCIELATVVQRIFCVLLLEETRLQLSGFRTGRSEINVSIKCSSV